MRYDQYIRLAEMLQVLETLGVVRHKTREDLLDIIWFTTDLVDKPKSMYA